MRGRQGGREVTAWELGNHYYLFIFHSQNRIMDASTSIVQSRLLACDFVLFCTKKSTIRTLNYDKRNTHAYSFLLLKLFEFLLLGWEGA